MTTSLEQAAEYIPYGEEWKKEMNKFPKSALIEMLGKALKELKQANYKEQAAADAEDKLLTMAIEKYSSPYGKANPETYAYKQGLIDGIGTPVNSIHCKCPNCQQDFDISPPVGTVIAGAKYTGQSVEGMEKIKERNDVIKQLEAIKEAFQWTWDNMDKPHTSDHFNVPANGINAIELLIKNIQG